MKMTEVLSESEIERAVEWLRRGEPVAFPTETVYGLGAPLYCLEAIGKIFRVKGRPKDNPLIAHVADIEEIEKIAIEIPSAFYRLAEVFFPGPLTVVLKRHEAVPGVVSAGLPTIAVRVPSHPVAQALLKALGEPLVAPSANLSGKPSATSAAHVLEDFQGKIAAIVDGGSSAFGLESTVIGLFDVHQPVLLRPGSITQSQVEEVLGQRLILPDIGTPASSPGMRYRHYAPQAPVRLFMDKQALVQHIQTFPCKHRMLLTTETIPEVGLETFPLQASSLYNFLRCSDRMGCEEVLVFCDAKTQSDSALMNRLSKAAESGCLMSV